VSSALRTGRGSAFEGPTPLGPYIPRVSLADVLGRTDSSEASADPKQGAEWLNRPGIEMGPQGTAALPMATLSSQLPPSLRTAQRSLAEVDRGFARCSSGPARITSSAMAL
jgi:hypothetical protein